MDFTYEDKHGVVHMMTVVKGLHGPWYYVGWTAVLVCTEETPSAAAVKEGGVPTCLMCLGRR